MSVGRQRNVHDFAEATVELAPINFFVIKSRGI